MVMISVSIGAPQRWDLARFKPSHPLRWASTAKNPTLRTSCVGHSDEPPGVGARDRRCRAKALALISGPPRVCDEPAASYERASDEHGRLACLAIAIRPSTSTTGAPAFAIIALCTRISRSFADIASADRGWLRRMSQINRKAPPAILPAWRPTGLAVQISSHATRTPSHVKPTFATIWD